MIEIPETDIENRQTVVKYPVGLFNIELTNHCPMRCVMCPRTNNMTRPKGYMEFSLFKKIIDELVSVNPGYKNNHPVWLHHFGESLLHKEFGRFIRYAAENEVRACLSINPVMLKKDVALELIQSGPYIIYISMDGHDEKSFEKIRGVKNVYRRSKDNVLYFLELKKKYRSNTSITLSMIDFHLNTESVKKTRQFWESLEGIDNFLLKDFSTWDGNAPDINTLSEKENQSKDISQPVVCNFPWERMTIMWDGDVAPCCYDYDKKLLLGNARTQKLTEIWNGKSMQALRNEFIKNKVVNQLCRNCDKLRLPRHLWQW